MPVQQIEDMLDLADIQLIFGIVVVIIATHGIQLTLESPT